ncbi:MAG: glycine rich domain-containing protein [Clostridia bacterium]
MKDNLSVVITMIVFVLLIIIFPLYNYFERQDNMSYNLALKATTNFVDEVLNTGYLDKANYEKYIDQISATGNIYDIQIEAHKKIFTKDTLNAAEYNEQFEVDYNEDIFEGANYSKGNDKTSSLNRKKLKNDVYFLNKGDQLYVKLKNSSMTMAGSVFQLIAPASQKERIVVDYGGIVKNNTWETTLTSNLFKDDIAVKLTEVKQAYKFPEDTKITFMAEVINLDINEEKNLSDKLIANLQLAEVKDSTTLSGKKTSPTRTTFISSVTNEEKHTKTIKYEVTFNFEKSDLDKYFDINSPGASTKRFKLILPANILQGIASKNKYAESGIINISKDIGLVDERIEGPYKIVSGKYLLDKAENVNIGDSIYYIVRKNKVSDLQGLKNIANLSKFSGNVQINDASDIGEFYYEISNIQGKIGEIGCNLSPTVDINTHYMSPFNIVGQTFDYVEGEQKVQIAKAGTYKLEVWGASGGGERDERKGSRAGKGGYSSGNTKLNEGDLLYVYTGGTPEASNWSKGGYNGGGNGNKNPASSGFNVGFGGGGGTDIRILGNSINNRLIVAGGGGGSDNITRRKCR